jgi:hypothetical protein
MLRVFTKTVGRFPKGTVRDWPLGTWKGIDQNVDSFSRPVAEAQPDHVVDRNREVSHGARAT